MLKSNRSFSIIIPTYKRHELLLNCLSCLAHYFDIGFQDHLDVLIEVIVTDDGQESELRSILGQRYPWCHYTAGPGLGPAANRNHGAYKATCEWLVFTDDDCLPQLGWIEAYANSADRWDVLEGKTSAKGSRTRADEECPINESGGFLWSCNFAIKRNIFLQLGGFNECFPAPAMEDVELNTRITKQNLARKFVPNAVVLHPWRRHKGFKFLQSHSESVANYVTLHPEAAMRFSLDQQFLKILRSCKKSIEFSISSKQYRGLARQILLNFYGAFTAWINVKYRR
jgi:GT2 family glycosyltransferase